VGLRPWGRALLLGAALIAVAGCQTLGSTGPTGGDTLSEAEMSDILSKPDAISALVLAGEQALQARQYDRAQQLFNSALKLDVTNADLQFLNGLSYHLIGLANDRTKLDLAEQGLQLALKFDPSHLAARYQLGLLYMDQRRFALAQGHFAAVALHRPDDATLLYNLAASSYYAHDPRMAEAALNQLSRISPEAQGDPGVVWAQAVIKAALNDNEAARRYLEAYRAIDEQSHAARLEGRLRAWQGFYEHDLRVVPAQFSSEPSYVPPADGGGTFTFESDPPPSGFGAPGPADPFAPSVGSGITPNSSNMVVVDVVLIGTQEDVRDTRGINLLNGLQMQFGNPTTGAYGLSWGRNNVDDRLNLGLDENTRTITSQIGIPAVTYSLNIANTANSQNEILAKPSLVAQSGVTSEFFSGTEILAAAVSGGDGDSVSVQKEVGVKLAITPEVLDGDLLRLQVVAERTFLTDPASSVLFEFRLDTTKTNVNSTVTMRFGETLILGGLSERESSRGNDGVPGLRDIPGLNYLFSERTERNFERSILILLTPRRPQYSRQAEEARDQTRQELSALERDLERLHKRHEDWFTPRPTFSEIIENMQQREFFEEFRSGDFQIRSWNDSEEPLEHISRIRERFT